MRFVACFLTLMLVVASVARGQDESDPFSDPELRKLLQTIQNKLHGGAAGGPADKRVTRIGSTRRAVPVEESLVVRIYDASDLFVVAPSYIAKHDTDIAQTRRPLFPVAGAGVTGSGLAGGGGFGGGSAGFNVSSKQRQIRPNTVKTGVKTLHQFDGTEAMVAPIDMRSARVSLDDLVDAITTTISPESWNEVGGEGSISTIGSSLLISQTEGIHEQITSLMNLFRERWGSLRTVSVVADWVWLTKPDLNELLDDESKVFGVVDAKHWRAFRAMPPAEDDRTGYSATITCQNGQTVHTLAGGQTLAVTSVVPVVGGAEKSVGYSPTISMIQEGAALRVTPISNRSGKFVTLDVHSRVSLLNEIDRREREGDDEVNAIVTAIDRPQITTQRLSTTLRAPVGQTMLVGGMTFEGKPQANDPNLYLFVTIAIQELRDDIPEKAEAAPEQPSGDG